MTRRSYCFTNIGFESWLIRWIKRIPDFQTIEQYKCNIKPKIMFEQRFGNRSVQLQENIRCVFNLLKVLWGVCKDPAGFKSPESAPWAVTLLWLIRWECVDRCRRVNGCIIMVILPTQPSTATKQDGPTLLTFCCGGFAPVRQKRIALLEKILTERNS